MAKKVKTQVKIQLPAGGATPAPPVGTALGPHGVNLMEFCKQFNAQTASKKGQTVPIVLTIYTDRSFDFITKTPPAPDLLKQKARIEKGASKPGVEGKIGVVSWKDIEEIATIKMQDLSAYDLEQAKKMIAGTARSMGIEISD